MTDAEVARQIGVSAATLRRWVRDGIVPVPDGQWTPPAVAQARIVARLRARGHSLKEVRAAAETGRLAYGYIEELFDRGEGTYTVADAAAATGLEPALIERLWTAIGLTKGELETITEADLELLRHVEAVLAAGFPLVALLQLVRVYGHSVAQMADAEVRLFHLYVHEPLIRDGVPGLEIAEEMEGLARDLLPLASPIMDHLHQRFLRHFVEQDVVGHLEVDADEGLDLGRLRVAVAFADLAGYTRLTEEAGDETAVDVVERFVEAVEATLPEDARLVKTIGDAVMVVASDVQGLCEWAVGFQALWRERPLSRIGMHHGAVLYRDGDYYGREVNLAARVGARSAGGEVLVTEAVAAHPSSHLRYDRIGQVRLKGFTGPTELYLARAREED